MELRVRSSGTVFGHNNNNTMRPLGRVVFSGEVNSIFFKERSQLMSKFYDNPLIRLLLGNYGVPWSNGNKSNAGNWFRPTKAFTAIAKVSLKKALMNKSVTPEEIIKSHFDLSMNDPIKTPPIATYAVLVEALFEELGYTIDKTVPVDAVRPPPVVKQGTVVVDGVEYEVHNGQIVENTTGEIDPEIPF